MVRFPRKVISEILKNDGTEPIIPTERDQDELLTATEAEGRDGSALNDTKTKIPFTQGMFEKHVQTFESSMQQFSFSKYSHQASAT